jgi:hypothetical protein
MFKSTHMQFHLQPKTSGNGNSSSTPSKTGTTYHQILQLPSHLSRSKLKWQNSLNRHCTYVFIQFLTLRTPARIYSMLNVGSIRKKKKTQYIFHVQAPLKLPCETNIDNPWK